jgi:hypothetical protein
VTDLDNLDVGQLSRDELPSLLGRVVEFEARIRLRLAETPAVQVTVPSTAITADEAAVIAGTSKRWILSHTQGMKFRCDLTRKQPRFDEAGLRAWLAGRRRG